MGRGSAPGLELTSSNTLAEAAHLLMRRFSSPLSSHSYWDHSSICGTLWKGRGYKYYMTIVIEFMLRSHEKSTHGHPKKRVDACWSVSIPIHTSADRKCFNIAARFWSRQVVAALNGSMPLWCSYSPGGRISYDVVICFSSAFHTTEMHNTCLVVHCAIAMQDKFKGGHLFKCTLILYTELGL